MTDESVTDEQQARTEFERAMRGCRRLVQDRMTPQLRELTLEEQKTLDIAWRSKR